jgi:hypothetical protein
MLIHGHHSALLNALAECCTGQRNSAEQQTDMECSHRILLIGLLRCKAERDRVRAVPDACRVERLPFAPSAQSSSGSRFIAGACGFFLDATGEAPQTIARDSLRFSAREDDEREDPLIAPWLACPPCAWPLAARTQQVPISVLRADGEAELLT